MVGRACVPEGGWGGGAKVLQALKGKSRWLGALFLQLSVKDTTLQMHAFYAVQRSGRRQARQARLQRRGLRPRRSPGGGRSRRGAQVQFWACICCFVVAPVDNLLLLLRID